jgi:CspA family cold shock protein
VTQGTVKSWLQRGFGFVNPDGADADIFVHVSALPDGLQSLQIGTRVEFREELDHRSGKMRVLDLRVLA